MVCIRFKMKKEIILYNFKPTIIIDCHKNYFNDIFRTIYKCNDIATYYKSNIVISGVVFGSTTGLSFFLGPYLGEAQLH